nr:MAG TPA: hypothetical protein [Caudoviricetes sp.]
MTNEVKCYIISYVLSFMTQLKSVLVYGLHMILEQI